MLVMSLRVRWVVLVCLFFFWLFINKKPHSTTAALELKANAIRSNFFITNYGFLLVNILLRKFDISFEKETKMMKNAKKSTCKHNVAVFTLNLTHHPVMEHAIT